MRSGKDSFKRTGHPFLIRLDFDKLYGTHRTQLLKPHVLRRDHAKRRHLRIVRRGERGEHLPLLVRNAILRTEELEMGRADIRYQRAVWLGYGAKRRYLAGMVCAHLDNEKFSIGRTVQDRNRKAKVVVVVAFRRIRPAGAREESLEKLLRGGLARRACQRHYDRIRPERAPVFPRKALQLVQRVRPADDFGRTLLQRLRNEIIAVCALALQRDIEHSRLDQPGIERRALEAEVLHETPREELR